MKQLLLLTAFILSSHLLMAQVNWTITQNNKVRLVTSSENETGNVIQFTKADLDKDGKLLISYKPPVSEKGWSRSVQVYNADDQQVSAGLDKTSDKSKPGYSFFILKNADLKELLSTNARIKIYTIAVPTDPAKAATVRVRRVHICTIEIK
jgi:hypothetical protein